MRYPDYKDYRANPDRKVLSILKTLFWGLVAAILLMAIYSWMDKRDQPHLSVMTYECAPEIEMSMPIERVRL